MVDTHVLGGLSDADIGGNPISKLDKDDIPDDELLGIALGLFAVLVDDGLPFEGRGGRAKPEEVEKFLQELHNLGLLCRRRQGVWAEPLEPALALGG